MAFPVLDFRCSLSLDNHLGRKLDNWIRKKMTHPGVCSEISVFSERISSITTEST